MRYPIVPVLVVGIVVVFAVYIERWAFARLRELGYTDLRNVIVRCPQGHLFTTTWIPGLSFKAVRLGMMRYQYCPIGKHWATVQPVDPSTLSAEERAFAMSHHDAMVP